jgi:hypothetical protein
VRNSDARAVPVNVMMRRPTLVGVPAEGRLVATASLQVRPDVPECGWVRWVATDLDRRREGLARALVIGVLAMAPSGM